jgi:hypothetical protein
MPEERMFGTEEALGKLIKEFTEATKKKLPMLSDLNTEEIDFLSILETIAKRINSKTIKTFVDTFLALRVSRFRLGRSEMVRIASYATAGYGGVEERTRKGLKSLIPGWR